MCVPGPAYIMGARAPHAYPNGLACMRPLPRQKSWPKPMANLCTVSRGSYILVPSRTVGFGLPKVSRIGADVPMLHAPADYMCMAMALALLMDGPPANVRSMMLQPELPPNRTLIEPQLSAVLWFTGQWSKHRERGPRATLRSLVKKTVPKAAAAARETLLFTCLMMWLLLTVLLVT